MDFVGGITKIDNFRRIICPVPVQAEKFAPPGPAENLPPAPFQLKKLPPPASVENFAPPRSHSAETSTPPQCYGLLVAIWLLGD